MNTIQINPADNVIVALSQLAKGTAVEVPGVGEVVAAEDIPQGHKMAVRSIAAGEDVIKYGLPIGHVTGDVQPGQWLHTHNVKTNLSGEVEYTYKYMEVIGCESVKSGQVTEEFIHIIVTAYFNGMFEVVRHNMDRAAARRYVKMLNDYHMAGFGTVFDPQP